MLNGFSTIIFNLHRMNLDVETWEKGDNAESFDNKLTDISEKIKVLMDGNTDNDKEPRKELNKMLTEEFINGFLNSFNSLNFKQQIDFKNLIKNVLKSHKEESRFDSKYKGLLILAQNLQIDIDGPNKEPLTELRNFVDNLKENGSPKMKLFKVYCYSVYNDFQTYKKFLDNENNATNNGESSDNPEKCSMEDFNLFVSMYTEFITLLSENLNKNIKSNDWKYTLNDSAWDNISSKVFPKYFNKKNEEYFDNLKDEILDGDYSDLDDALEESDDILENYNEILKSYRENLYALKEDNSEWNDSEWNEAKPEWDVANS